MTGSTYDAHSIKILKGDEMDVFPWHMIQTLCDKYHAPLESVTRGVETCHITGVPISYFEDRYLKGDKSVPINETYSLAYKENLLNMRERSWVLKN